MPHCPKHRHVTLVCPACNGELGGKEGADAVNRAMSPEERQARAHKAAHTRWGTPETEPLMVHLRNRLTEIRRDSMGTAYVNGARFPLNPLRPGARYGFQASDELITIDQLAERLKISKTAAYGLTRHRAKVRSSQPLPFFKVGKELRFNWTKVIEWLDGLEKGVGNVS